MIGGYLIMQKIIFAFLAFFAISSAFAAEPLTVWIMPNGASPQEKLEQELELFTKSTGIKTKVVVLDWGEAWNRISTALNTGKDMPAVLQLGTTWIPYFASRGELLELNPSLSKIDPSRFVPVSFYTTHVDGDTSIYSVPWFIDARAILANERILKELNIKANDISTYKGFLKALKKIKAASLKLDDGTPIQAYAFPGRNDWNIPHNFAPWIWSNGGNFVVKKNNTYQSNLLSPKTLQGIALYLNFVLDSVVDAANLNLNTAQISQQFNNGEIAFILNTSEIVMQTRFQVEDGGLLHSRIGNDGVVVFPVPSGSAGSVSFIGGSNLAIPAKYKNKKQALDLLLYLTQDQFLDAYTKQIGFLPPSKKVLESWSQDSVYNVLVECLKNGQTYRGITQWGEIEGILGKTFSSIWASMEIEGLYSEEKIYSILRENDSLINVALGVNQPKDIISLEQFKTLWSSTLEEMKMDEIFSSEEKMSEAANKNEEKSIVDKKVSIGIFILMLLFGFIFAYQRKKK
jgi:multiple sugar transport system substrate-binding protein